MLCNISGQPPEQPVVSRRTGHLFEKRLITKVVQDTGRCPKTGEALSLDDLIPVVCEFAPKQRGMVTQSIPALLQLLHGEWDMLVLEQFQMRQQLQQAQQDVSHALYQHDAACRIIAKLMKERDLARSQQANIAAAEYAEAKPEVAKEEEPVTAATNSLPEDVSKTVLEVYNSLSQKRRNRTISQELAPASAVSRYVEVSDCMPHSNMHQQVLSVLHTSNFDSNPTALTTGADACAVFTDLTTMTPKGMLAGHAKPIRHCAELSRSIYCTGSDDATCRVWTRDGDTGSAAHVNSVVVRTDGPVTGLVAHPTQHHFLAATARGVMHFCDFHVGTVLANGKHSMLTKGISSLGIHPDGTICATSTPGVDQVQLWDVRQMTVTLRCLKHADGNNISSIAFNENGLFVATGTNRGVVTVWDLRNQKPVWTHNVDQLGGTTHTNIDVHINRVVFDQSGTYLAVAADSVRLCGTKDGKMLVNLAHHTDVVNDVAFAPDAKAVISCSDDRHLKQFGSATD